ncbi:MAG: DUF4239 domain-containing protein [Pseudomonas sp.]
MDLTGLLCTLSIALFVLVLLSIEVGRRIRTRELRFSGRSEAPGLGAVNASIFGLLGLLIAFTFSGAAERLDARRALIVEEANAIGTAWLRLDLLPAADLQVIRPIFRHYVDRRIDYFNDVFDSERRTIGARALSELQIEVWSRTIKAVQRMDAPALGSPVVQAMNEMFDVASKRNSALAMHPPYIVYGMLVLLVLISAFLIGFGMGATKRRLWLHSIGYALVMTVTLYVIVDFEVPRAGGITVYAFDALLEQLRQSL